MSPSRTLGALIALALGACSSPPGTADAGVDAGVDFGVDSGPPYLPFEPRLLFSDPSVRCEPAPPLAIAPVPAPRLPPGSTRWVYRPTLDPAAQRALSGFGGPGLGFYGAFAGLADGSFIAPINNRFLYLSVSSAGVFRFLIYADQPKFGPTFLPPATVISRPQGDTIIQFFNLENLVDNVFAIAGPVPGYPPLGDWAGPAVLPDGTVAWTPTERTLMAVCRDGHVRWVLEYYNVQHGPQIQGLRDDSIFLASTTAEHAAGVFRNDDYHIDGDGAVISVRRGVPFPILERPPGGTYGYSERCGVVSIRYDGLTPRVEYASLDDYVVTHAIPGGYRPTSDCGAWTQGAPFRRYRADGSLGFEYTGTRLPGLDGEGIPFELADGSWLFVSDGSGRPAGMTIVDDTGRITFDRDFDSAIGENLTANSYLLTPDGVLYVATSSALESVQQIAAIEIGIGRAPTWISNGGNWARDNATWHPVPAAP